MQKVWEFWDSIMIRGNVKYVNMWLEYYNLERVYGDIQYCWKVLYWVVQCISDYLEYVCEVLFIMERIEGFLEDWDIVVQKIEI